MGNQTKGPVRREMDRALAKRLDDLEGILMAVYDLETVTILLLKGLVDRMSEKPEHEV